MKLAGYVYNQQGQPVVGATVEAYTYTGQLVGSTSTDGSGYWEFPNLANGLYRVKASYQGLVRWVEGAVDLQVRTIVGPDGVSAPLPPLSVSTSQLQDSAVTTAKLANGAVTYPKIGTPLLVTGSETSTIRYQETATYTAPQNAWVRVRRFVFNCVGTVWIGFEAKLNTSGYSMTIRFRLASPTHGAGTGSGSYDWVTNVQIAPPTTYTAYSAVVPVLPGASLFLDLIGNNMGGSIRNLTVRFDPVTDPLQVVVA